jgi:hypothetical protein
MFKKKNRDRKSLGSPSLLFDVYLTFSDLVSRSANVSSLCHRAPMLRISYVSFFFAFVGLTRKDFPALLIIIITSRFLSLCCYEQFFCVDIVRDKFICKYVVNSSKKNSFQSQPLSPRLSELQLLYAMICYLPKIYFIITFLFQVHFTPIGNIASPQDFAVGLLCPSVCFFISFLY